MKSNLYKYLDFAFLLITISSVNVASTLPIGNTFFWWLVNFFTITLFIWARKFYHPENVSNILILKIYLYWNIICIIRGFTVAENYWEWKNLIGISAVLLLPLSISVSSNTTLLQEIFRFWLKYMLPLFFLFLPFIYEREGVGYYLAPLTLFILFMPALKRRWKFILICYSLFVLLGDIDARSNVIKFSVALLLSFLYIIKPLFRINVLKFIRICLMIAPFALFGLAVTNVFNIFNMDEYVGNVSVSANDSFGQSEKVSLTVDTRTFIYQEVISSALKYNYWLLGRTPARGNESESFGFFLADELNTGKMERFANEVSILNIFTWTGLVGAILYFIIFYQSSYLAVCKSNNAIIKIVGLYISFRWCYAWVEDFNNFDLSYIFLWIMIGMSFSKSFRNMSDIQITNWIQSVFNIQYKKSFK